MCWNSLSQPKRPCFNVGSCYDSGMPTLTPAVKRQRMIDWYNWRNELPRLREEKKQYKLREREFQKELEEKDRIIAEREKRIKELEEENQKLKGTQKKLREIVFKPAERQQGENNFPELFLGTLQFLVFFLQFFDALLPFCDDAVFLFQFFLALPLPQLVLLLFFA